MTPTVIGPVTASADAVVLIARSWLGDDPDEATRAELEDLLTEVAAGDEEALVDLADRFSGPLVFGTAGLRGRLGAGPNRMNRAVVIRAAAGLTAYLQRLRPDPVVVIGFDARHNSAAFARDTAAVVTAAGGRALLLPRALPTPVLAFAIRHLGADAGVMVTASHNPAEDNGYKVYLGDGMQIVPPADVEIAACIAGVPSVASVPRADDGWETLDDSVVEAYVAGASRVVDAVSPRDIRVVHTALHGVGTEVVCRVFGAAGFPAVYSVAAQAHPDPEFPTVPFPNPEEPGAIDMAVKLAGQLRPDIVIANDPDADRCAVAVPDRAAPHGWRMLTGDELGVLLGQHIVNRGVRPRDVPSDVAGIPCFANSIVSSRLLKAMSAAAGIRHEETLTGFKWIARPEGLRYGYEEAIGYCVAPTHVRDKDGITAALLVAELAAELRSRGSSLTGLLDDLAAQFGVYATDAYSVRVADLSTIPPILERLRRQPPRSLGREQVVRLDDLALGLDGLPPTEGVRLVTARDSRIIVRPSGTEPKLKVYLEVIESVPGQRGPSEVAAARLAAATRLKGIKSAMSRHTRPQ